MFNGLLNINRCLSEELKIGGRRESQQKREERRVKEEEKTRKMFLNEGKFGSINLIAYLCKRFIRV